MKKIVVACGTGMVTSTLIAEKIKKLLNANSIPYSISQCIVGEIENHADGADLIVTAMKIDKQFKAPMIAATGLIAGINEDMIEGKILEVLKK